MSEVNIWDALSRVRALPLAEAGEEILRSAGDGDPVPTLHILSATMRGLAHYLTARDAGESREGAEHYGKRMRFRAIHGLHEDDGYAIAKEQEQDFFGGDSYRPESEVAGAPDRDRQLAAMLSAMNSTDDQSYPETLREYLEAALTPMQLATIKGSEALAEAGIDYAAVYQRYHADVWELVMDSEDAGWPEFLYTNGDIDSHMDLCRRIVRRAAEWLSHDKWSSPEGGALAQVKRTANGWRVEGMLNACCHRIAYSWDLDRLPADSELALLVENAEARSRDCLSQDVREGELVASVSYPDADDAPEEEVEVFGWWSIAR